MERNKLVTATKKAYKKIYDGKKRLQLDLDTEKWVAPEETPTCGFICPRCNCFSDSWDLYLVGDRTLCLNCAVEHYEDEQRKK